MPASCAIRGSFFDFIDDPWMHPGHEERAARFFADGLLVIRDGIIEDFGHFADLSRRHTDVTVTHLQNRLILPGFIDGHIHFPQLRVLGAFGNQLLDWLQTWIFPEELKYHDRELRAHRRRALLRRAARRRHHDLPWPSPPAARCPPRSSSRRRPGAACVSLPALPASTVSPLTISSSRRMTSTAKPSGSSSVTTARAGTSTPSRPAFLASAASEMLERCRQLKQEHQDCWINTHISENPSEVRMVRSEFPDCEDYTAVHAKHGLLGPKFVAGHGVWLSNDEFRRFSAGGGGHRLLSARRTCSWAAACSASAGPLDPEHPVRVALGSDMGGGNAFSIVRVLEEAYKVGMCNNTMLDGSVNCARPGPGRGRTQQSCRPTGRSTWRRSAAPARSISTTSWAISTRVRRPTSWPSTGTPARRPCAGASR